MLTLLGLSAHVKLNTKNHLYETSISILIINYYYFILLIIYIYIIGYGQKTFVISWTRSAESRHE